MHRLKGVELHNIIAKVDTRLLQNNIFFFFSYSSEEIFKANFKKILPSDILRTFRFVYIKKKKNVRMWQQLQLRHK